MVDTRFTMIERVQVRVREPIFFDKRRRMVSLG